MLSCHIRHYVEDSPIPPLAAVSLFNFFIFLARMSFWISSTDRLSFLLSADTIPNDLFGSVFLTSAKSASVPIRCVYFSYKMRNNYNKAKIYFTFFAKAFVTYKKCRTTNTIHILPISGVLLSHLQKFLTPFKHCN